MIGVAIGWWGQAFATAGGGALKWGETELQVTVVPLHLQDPGGRAGQVDLEQLGAGAVVPGGEHRDAAADDG